MQEILLSDIFDCNARITSIQGTIITAPLRHTFIGERCRIYRSLSDPRVIGQAETIGFSQGNAVLCLLGGSDGISCSNIIVPDGTAFSLSVSMDTLGTVINAQGEICERFASPPLTTHLYRCFEPLCNLHQITVSGGQSIAYLRQVSELSTGY